jgi:hypothetical protein
MLKKEIEKEKKSLISDAISLKAKTNGKNLAQEDNKREREKQPIGGEMCCETGKIEKEALLGFIPRHCALPKIRFVMERGRRD